MSIQRHSKNWPLALILSCMLTLAACSDDDSDDSEESEESERHVWEDQTGTIDKARDISDKLKRSAEETRKAADN